MVFSNIFMFTPYLGKWSNLTNIFQDRLKPPTSWFLLVLFGWSQDVSKSLTGFLCFWVQDFLGLSFLSSSALWELDCGMGWDSKNTFEKRGWNRIWIVWPFFGHDFWSTLLLFFFFSGRGFPNFQESHVWAWESVFHTFSLDVFSFNSIKREHSSLFFATPYLIEELCKLFFVSDDAYPSKV